MVDAGAPAARPWLLPVACFTALAVVYAAGQLLGDAAERNQRRQATDLARELLPAAYDNDLPADRATLRSPAHFGAAATTAYRARRGALPVGVIFHPVTATGYNGPLELAVGVHYSGALSGVRVLRHQETPGLGAGVHQDNSSWILGFTGRSRASLAAAPPSELPGGAGLDALSGATISRRAVIRAVERALDYYRSHRQELFSRPAARDGE